MSERARLRRGVGGRFVWELYQDTGETHLITDGNVVDVPGGATRPLPCPVVLPPRHVVLVLEFGVRVRAWAVNGAHQHVHDVGEENTLLIVRLRCGFDEIIMY